jgi:hypothetical protein
MLHAVRALRLEKYFLKINPFAAKPGNQLATPLAVWAVVPGFWRKE